ncbi:hypothetical protein [Streptomyces sp. CA2R101]|uniref:hypothetical protein n=1 Tax=Streptomyces sp. CA2R101 TaxID=3120152 RepID=UPI00300A6DFF
MSATSSYLLRSDTTATTQHGRAASSATLVATFSNRPPLPRSGRRRKRPRLRRWT